MGPIQKNGKYRLSLRGVTLIELLIVLIIIGLMASMVIIKFDFLGESAAKKVAMTELKMIKAAIVGTENFNTGYYHETRLPDRLPKTLACLVSLTEEKAENPGVPDSEFTWDPNHRRGYRPNGYLSGEGQEDGSSVVSLLDPWEQAYEIFVDPGGDIKLHKVYSPGPDQTASTADDIVVFLFKQ